MATRAEKRLGVGAAVGNTYVQIGPTVVATYNSLIHLTNVTGNAIKVRVFIADNSWTTGEPTGSTLKVRLAYDLPIEGNGIRQISGNILLANEKLVAFCDIAASLDIAVNGVEVS